MRPSDRIADRHLLSLLDRSVAHALRVRPRAEASPQLLDFGCGDQPLRAVMSELGYRYVPCDVSGEAELRAVEGERLPSTDASFDAVLSTQVLEHVWDVTWYLGECRRVLRKSGVLVLSTHGSWPYHPHPGDYRRWTKVGLEREITGAGFRVVKTTELLSAPAWVVQFAALALDNVLRRAPIPSIVRSGVAHCSNTMVRLVDAVAPESLRANNAAVYVVVAEPA